jgi:hypothetical protein
MKSPTFKDATGREWKPFITCLVARKFEDDTGKNIFTQEAIQALMEFKSLSLLLKLAFLSCERQAIGAQISYDEFCDSFQNDQHIKRMFIAMGAAIVLFTQSRPDVVNALEAAMKDFEKETEDGVGKPSTN